MRWGLFAARALIYESSAAWVGTSCSPQEAAKAAGVAASMSAAASGRNTGFVNMGFTNMGFMNTGFTIKGFMAWTFGTGSGAGQKTRRGNSGRRGAHRGGRPV